MSDEACGWPRRKITRLPSYDYSGGGAYFITICATKKACVFGEVKDGDIVYSPLGLIVVAAITDLPNHYPHVELDAFVVMPNHVHAVLLLGERSAVAMQKTDTTGRVPTHGFGQPVEGSLSVIVGSLKARVKRQARGRLGWQGPVWQARFHEHVIRDDEDLHNVRKYILENPLRWELDRENPRNL